MDDPNVTITLALSGLTGLAMVLGASLSGWRGWLALKRQELQQRPAVDVEPGLHASGATARIEIADLKERIRKLEAIAAGVEL